MNTPISEIVSQTRILLNDTGSSPYWSDQELALHCVQGMKDLWKGIIHLRKRYFVKGVAITIPQGTAKVNPNTITDFPTDIYKIRQIGLNVSAYPQGDVPGIAFSYLDRYDASRLGETEWEFTGRAYQDFVSPRIPGDDVNFINYSVLGEGTSNVKIELDAPLDVDVHAILFYICYLDPFTVSDTTSGREAAFDDSSFDLPANANPNQFYEVDFKIPGSGVGQVYIGSSLSPTFDWSRIRQASISTEGLAITSSRTGRAFPVTHTGASPDYTGDLIDIGNMSLGRTSSDDLMIGFDSQLALDTLFPGNLTIYNIEVNPTTQTRTVDLDHLIDIPGEPDQALINWTVGYASTRQREGMDPEINWIRLYGDEKKNIINALADEGPASITEPAATFIFTNSIGVNTQTGI